MAVLQQPTNRTNPFADKIGDALAPAGTFIATVIDIHDEFGVTRQKFQSTEVEKVDLTCFLFGFRDAQGVPHKIASRQMRISGNEKSALFGFLKGLLGRAPAYGWDYCSLKGAKCLLTVEHIQRRDGSGVFAAIAALSPVPAGFGVSVAPAQTVPSLPPPPPVAPVTQPRPQPTPAAVQAPAAPSVTTEEDDIPF
ncbi:MAG: hypothetical protein M5U12_12315 [Verrucomicrobia bacterium]|nr:hypothetical protein [Verrucomicrobiota bacterium]